jgi:hypothetical protein
MCVERVSAMCTAGVPRSRSVALEGRLVGCLYRAPPRPRGRRPRGLILTALGGCEWAERRCGRERRQGVQKPLAACQGKTVPGAVRLVALGRSVPGGPPRPPAAGSPGSVRRRAPHPGQRRRRCRIRAWLESEGRHLVHLVADAQREVVKGSANDGVGTVVQRLHCPKSKGMNFKLAEHDPCKAHFKVCVCAKNPSAV